MFLIESQDPSFFVSKNMPGCVCNYPAFTAWVFCLPLENLCAWARWGVCRNMEYWLLPGN